MGTPRLDSREVARAVESADEMVKGMTVQRFEVPYSEAAVEDLRERLKNLDAGEGISIEQAK